MKRKIANYVIYVDERDINDATTFYISIIKSAIIRVGRPVEILSDVKLINEKDTVIVVKVTSAFRVLLRNHKQKIIIWLQGIQPEEALMGKGAYLKKLYYYLALRYLERVSFKRVNFMIYVSQAMKEHYERRFGKSSRLDFVMPCFNLKLNLKAFNIKKYQHPTFVYAGSLDEWQCFEPTIEVYKRIKTDLPNATLTVFTKDIPKANSILLKHNLSNVEVKYVPKELIQDELKKYKYGFILRKDHIVNRVATPTKLNSYMASGIIPIVSSCLEDFISHTKEAKNILNVGETLNPSYIANKILEFESQKISLDGIKQEYQTIFNNYYNSKKYIENLANLILTYENSSYN